MSLNKNQQGFTIVELLIVIVVIAILAAISIVAYSGIQSRARTSSGQQLASQVAKKLEAYYAINGAYPTLRSQIQGTSESNIDGIASGTTADTIPLVLAASDSLFSATTLTADTGNNGQTVRVNGSASGGNVYYWSYSAGAEASIKYGP